MANILYIGFFSLPDKDAAANRVMNNAKAMRAAGHTVYFIDEQENCDSNIARNQHSVCEFQVWSAKRPHSKKRFLKKMISIDNIVLVMQMIGNIDVVIAYNFPSIALVKLVRYGKKHNVAITADCTEWYSGKDYNFPMNFLSAGDSFLRMRIVQKKLDGIIGISNYLCNYYRKCKNDILVPPLVDKKDCIWQQGKCYFDKDKLNLVYNGNLAKSKEAFLPIIDAIEISSNRDKITLRIVGATREQFLNLMPNLKERIVNLDRIVVFCGRVSHEDSVNILKSSDFLIFFREDNRVTKAGFSTKFVEAVSCGTSVITTNTGDLEQYFRKLNCGYLLTDDMNLNLILDKDIDELKEKAQKIKNTNLFDFREYISDLNTWIRTITNE